MHNLYFSDLEGAEDMQHCIKKKPEEAPDRVKKVHTESRMRFYLPSEVPRGMGIRCRLCANECSIPDWGLGYCGLRKNQGGKLVQLAGTPDKGIVQCYYDPLPTNCVATRVLCGRERCRLSKVCILHGDTISKRHIK